MPDQPIDTLQLHAWINRMHSCDEAARNDLLRGVGVRLEQLARKMLRRFPNVHRWADTDDVLQNALMRLLRGLQQMQAPGSMREFYALAAQQLRRELLDLARHYQALPRQGDPPAGKPSGASSTDPPRAPAGPSDSSSEPSKLAVWSEFHGRVEALPEAEQEVVDLLWYQGLPQAEAAALLHVDVRTLKRRWQAARLKLAEVLPGEAR